MADFKGGQLALFLVRRDSRVPVPVDIGDPQPRPDVRYFLAHNDPHPGRPGGQIEHPGDVGDPCAVSFNSGAGVGPGPPLLRDQGQNVGHRTVDGEPHGVREIAVLGGEHVQKPVSAASGVGADHDLPARPVSLGQLLHGVSNNLDMVSSSVRAGIARTQQSCQGFPCAQEAVVNERTQRVKTEPVFERRRACFLSAEGRDQRQ